MRPDFGCPLPVGPFIVLAPILRTRRPGKNLRVRHGSAIVATGVRWPRCPEHSGLKAAWTEIPAPMEDPNLAAPGGTVETEETPVVFWNSEGSEADAVCWRTTSWTASNGVLGTQDSKSIDSKSIELLQTEQTSWVKVLPRKELSMTNCPTCESESIELIDAVSPDWQPTG